MCASLHFRVSGSERHSSPFHVLLYSPLAVVTYITKGGDMIIECLCAQLKHLADMQRERDEFINMRCYAIFKRVQVEGQ